MNSQNSENVVVPSVPDVGGGENGNNVLILPPVNALYKYDFVINNYRKTEVCAIKLSIPKLAKKAILGFEVGENGTPHIQGYISLKRKMRITALTKWAGFERSSMRAVRNDIACQDYCRKDNDYWEYGFPKPIVIITELRTWQDDILNLYLGPIDERKIYWFWEPTGGIGKSAFIKFMIVTHSILFCSGGKHTDIMNLVFNQDMDNSRGVFFDIPRAHEGKISYSALECIKNGMVCNTKYETGVKIFNSPHVFVFANFPPDDESKMSADRWVITEL